LEDGTPDHPGEALETADASSDAVDAAKPTVTRAQAPPPTVGEHAADQPLDQPVVRAALREPVPSADATMQESAKTPDTVQSPQGKMQATGTVVLDVEQGGIEVPSFVGKTVRGAVEAAQDAGLELDAVGSGIARQQTPAAGSHVAAGARITVQFGR
jgi:cell division protein FtsI (penicillin-binding protein 3)